MCQVKGQVETKVSVANLRKEGVWWALCVTVVEAIEKIQNHSLGLTHTLASVGLPSSSSSCSDFSDFLSPLRN